MTCDVIRFTFRPSSLGLVLVASSNHGLRAVLIGDDAGGLELELRSRCRRVVVERDDAGMDEVAGQVVDFLEQPRSSFDAPLDPAGTDFQRAVWAALRGIPPGETATYGQIAARIGRPRSTRAVGQACGANPIAVIVPCHRVVGSGGQLTGFRWGVERKRALLAREGLTRAATAGAADAPATRR